MNARKPLHHIFLYSVLMVCRFAESVAASPELDLQQYLLPQHHQQLQFRQPLITPFPPSPDLDRGMIVRMEADEDEDLLVTEVVTSI